MVLLFGRESTAEAAEVRRGNSSKTNKMASRSILEFVRELVAQYTRPKTSEFGLDRAVAPVGSLRYLCSHAIEILQAESVAFRPYLSYRGALSHQVEIVGPFPPGP